MKVEDIATEGWLDTLKSNFKAGRDQYTKQQAAKLGMVEPQVQTATSPVPTTPKPAAAPKPQVNLRLVKQQISKLSIEQQKKLYYYLQDTLF